MAKHDLFTTTQFIDAIPGTGGIITTIAQKVGCTWHTAQKYIHGHPTVQQAYDNECERVLDMAESKLINAMNANDLESIKWYLARKGKRRGYSERTELSGPNGGPIEQEVTTDINYVVSKLLPEPTAD